MKKYIAKTKEWPSVIKSCTNLYNGVWRTFIALLLLTLTLQVQAQQQCQEVRISALKAFNGKGTKTVHQATSKIGNPLTLTGDAVGNVYGISM